VQTLIAAAIDGELRPRRRRALDRHLGGCTVCQREMASTTALVSALAGLPMEAAVPARLEQATLRQVRLLGEETQPGWWRRLSLPALAFATASVLAIVITRGREVSLGPPAEHSAPATGAARSAAEQVARAPERPAQTVARATSPRGQIADALPTEPPLALAAAPDLFMNLQILRHLEKLEHFEAIQTTTLDDAPAAPGGDEGRSSG